MKIKHVFIQAFRLFGKVPVNLTSTLDPNKASNFVAIYAPNGFGKTSFFDAMEFCVTKSIQRVSVNFKENFKVDQEQGSTTLDFNGNNLIFLFWLVLIIFPMFDSFEGFGISIKKRKQNKEEDFLTAEYHNNLIHAQKEGGNHE